MIATFEKYSKNQSLKFELITWWLPLFLVGLMALWIRTNSLGYDLPVTGDRDEPYYFAWAQAIRETGRPDVENGTGYPPGILYLQAAEQPVVEFLRGPALNKSVDYYLYARYVNSVFGVAAVILAALLGRYLGRSRLIGLACGLVIANLSLAVYESRRGSANAPWLFFTLLTLCLLFLAHKKNSLTLLYLTVASGIISFLFKYQSGVILSLPFLYALSKLRENKKLFWHMCIWGLVLAALLAWLIFSYKIFQIVNTPNSDTGSAISENKLVGFQSITSNWKLLANQLDGYLPLGVAVATILVSLVLTFKKALTDLIDGPSIVAIAIFGVLFYFLMSLFQLVLPSKWLVLVVALAIIETVGAFALVNFLGRWLRQSTSRYLQIAGFLLLPVVFAVFAGNLLITEQHHWALVYQELWSQTTSLNALNSWYNQQVPQRGRVVIEANKMINQYVYPPPEPHQDVVGSIFNKSVEAYRQGGYDYLVWNNLNTTPNDGIDDLDARKSELTQQGAKEVLRLSAPQYVGPTIVVFQLPPLEQNPLYAWFTPSISFRGYDLNQPAYKPGDEVRLMLYWESAEATTANYIVFVHVVDSATGKLLVGQDGPPDYGNTPTWKWQGDMQLIRDQHIFNIPPEAVAGSYTLSIGLYDADTQQPVTITDLQNQPIGGALELQQITIVP